MVSLFMLIMMFGFGCAVLMLSVTYTSTALKNATSMEEIEYDRYECLEHHKAPSVPKYDKGMLKNWKEFMGDTFWCWVCPFVEDKRNNDSFSHDDYHLA